MKVIAVQIFNERDSLIADEGRKRIVKHIKEIETVLQIRLDKKASPYHTKLQLLNSINNPFIFCDSDWWPINNFHLSEIIDQDKINGCIDVGVDTNNFFVSADCENLGIDKNKYINTGFFYANPQNENHKKAFNYALQLWPERKKLKLADFGEQSVLNIGIVESGSGPNILPGEYNYCPIKNLIPNGGNFTRNTYAIHAAGITRKEEFLKTFSECLSGDYEKWCSWKMPEIQADQ